MDIDKQEDKTTEADARTSHGQDSVSHDVPIPTSESVSDKQEVEHIGTDTVDASHERPSMSHDSDVATATLPPVDRQSGIPDSNEADSPGSSPPHLSPQGGDSGGGMADVYTKRGYTSEIFKIELSNLPKKLSFTVSKII